MTKTNKVIIIGVLLVVLVLVIIGPTLSLDLAWCIDNYSTDRLAHCLWYENNVFGRFVQPGGF